MNPCPPETKTRLLPKASASDTVAQAVLLSPYVAEGTVVFHPQQGQAGGAFFPEGTPIEIYEKTRCQMLLAQSRVLLNITVFPAPRGSREGGFPFEFAAWEPLVPPARHLAEDWALGFEVFR